MQIPDVCAACAQQTPPSGEGLNAPRRSAATSTDPDASRRRAWICRKKLQKCLAVSLEMATFAPDSQANHSWHT